MKLENIDGVTHVWVRQSWLDTAMRCPERARLNHLHPDMSVTSDSAAIGTAVHAGIEASLTGKRPLTAIHDEWDGLFAQPLNRTLGMQDVEMVEEAVQLFNAWEAEIAPSVGEPTHVEETFDVPWYEAQVGDHRYHVHLAGTMDLATKDSLWDWKTSSRRYAAAEKQSTAIQPTVYAVAAHRLGWLEMPLDFNYGVLIRKQHTSQIVRCHRTANHESWLARIVDPIVRQAIVFGFNEPWTINDTHSLCNERWCPYWQQCKGHCLTVRDITLKEKH